MKDLVTTRIRYFRKAEVYDLWAIWRARQRTKIIVESLNKGHIGIRSTVPCSTVEPLNKGHIGIRFIVPCRTSE